MGGSYGGYATLVGVTFTPSTFACGVDIVGPSNLVTLLSSIPPYWTSLLDEFSRLVGDPRTEAGRALLTERSPLSRVDAIEKPLLIGQGANDPRVKQSESDQIVAVMQEKDLPVTYVLFPDEGHGFARPENRLAFFGITEGFLPTCLGGRFEPLGDALDGSSTQVPAGAAIVPGLAVLRYLYDNSRVDAQWSVLGERGYTWWADGLAQRAWSEPALDDDGIAGRVETPQQFLAVENTRTHAHQ